MTINFPHGKNNIATPFDLKAVRIGKETVHARPIAWDREDADGAGNDSNGVPMSAVRFTTTCPSCSQLVEFGTNDVFTGKDGTPNNVVCISCQAGVEHTPDKQVAIVKIVEAKSPFADPIAENSMSTALIEESQPFKVDE